MIAFLTASRFLATPPANDPTKLLLAASPDSSSFYVAAVVDLFSRRVVVWAVKAEMTAQLVADALIVAIWRRGKSDSLLHHSDQEANIPASSSGA